jgi:general secretion pathway protein G
MRKFRASSGFTLIEMLLVLFIIGILVTVVVVKFGGRQEEARITAARADIKAYSLALDMFELDNGFYPTAEQGLDALVDSAKSGVDAARWRGPYVQSIKKDPWGNAYVYRYPSAKNPRSYDIISYGPNGVEGGGDDITNWD